MNEVLNQEVKVTIRVVVVSIMEAQDKLDSIQLVMIGISRISQGR